jgi:hypothetical protein
MTTQMGSVSATLVQPATAATTSEATAEMGASRAAPAAAPAPAPAGRGCRPCERRSEAGLSA